MKDVVMFSDLRRGPELLLFFSVLCNAPDNFHTPMTVLIGANVVFEEIDVLVDPLIASLASMASIFYQCIFGKALLLRGNPMHFNHHCIFLP